MKLKKGFVTHNSNGEQILVAADGSFNGIAKSNKTAAFIVDCLKEETTKEEIIDKMVRVYDAPRETIEKDVTKIIEQLNAIGAIE